MDECELCDGELMPIGTLGSREYLRCRNCGMQFSREKHEEEILPEPDGI